MDAPFVLVQMTSGQYFKVSPEDLERVSARRWRLGRGGYPVSKHQPLHRFLLDSVDSGMVADHINRDKLDNRRCNLRICSQRENSRNRVGRHRPTTPYKGVRWRPEYGTYAARIMVDRKEIWLGAHATAEAAAEAYNRAALAHFGQFAHLNVIASPDPEYRPALPAAAGIEAKAA